MGAHGKRTAKCSTAAAGHSYPPILIIFFIFFALMTLVFLGTPHRHSCFTVEEVTWASHQGESHCMSHHVVVDRAAIDNRHESEHLPLCPWYERADTRKTCETWRA